MMFLYIAGMKTSFFLFNGGTREAPKSRQTDLWQNSRARRMKLHISTKHGLEHNHM